MPEGKIETTNLITGKRDFTNIDAEGKFTLEVDSGMNHKRYYGLQITEYSSNISSVILVVIE